MKVKSKSFIAFVVLSLFLISCSFDALAGATSTPQPTSTPEATSTNTPTPTKTPIPTRTPNLAATQQYEDWQAEIQSYADNGYIPSAEGKIEKMKDFNESWAQIGWYSWQSAGARAKNFVYSGHFKWSSDSETPNRSGCGFLFATNDEESHYAVFIDTAEIRFRRVDGNTYRGPVNPTRGSKNVNFKESPYETDFTIIVYDYYAYVLIDGELKAEYTLAKSQKLEGYLAFAVLSGTNTGYGTKCEVTNGYIWRPNE